MTSTRTDCDFLQYVLIQVGYFVENCLEYLEIGHYAECPQNNGERDILGYCFNSAEYFRLSFWVELNQYFEDGGQAGYAFFD